MRSAESPVLSTLRGLAEPMLALAAAFSLTLLLTVPFVPTRLELELTLRPTPGADAASHAEVERAVEAAGVAEEVRVLLARGASRLTLTGVADRAAAERVVGDLLESSGYQRDEVTERQVMHFERMLQADARTLPIVMSIQTVIFLGAGLLLARGRLSPRVRDDPMSLAHAGLLGVAGGVVAVILSTVLGLLLEALGLSVEEQAWLRELFSDPSAVLRFSPWVVVIGPISEEVFFRYYMFRFISRHAGLATGMFVSALAFAFVHFNFSGLLVYVAIGVVFAWVYQRSGRLIAPMLAHVTLNAIVMVMSVLAVHWGF